MGGELPARISSITAAKLSNLSTMPMELTVDNRLVREKVISKLLIKRWLLSTKPFKDH